MINARAVIRSRTPILFVTIDSLRYDVAASAIDEGRTPQLAQLLPGGQWERRWTPGTFTLPAHMAFFSGFLPKLPTPQQPPRLWECRPPAVKTVDPRTFVFDAPNLLRGLNWLRYTTVCIGGVTYFSGETHLGCVLPAMFDDAYWRPEWGSPEPDSTRHQVDFALTLAEDVSKAPLFLFMNISATHVPHSHYLGDSTDTAASQKAALGYADEHLGRLINQLTSQGPWLIILCADHGDAFGEDGFHGRGIAHPVVTTVPYAAWLAA
ncbi:STM4013/SEN3800 family hydrolase [Streptomyces sp. NPDC050264]|uniref:STM4013/SEN3800 family hydrolase n=1 Tax=Streptomyces sp. NPDC050264 TaxID=3155038 RepID=UPI00343ABC3F